MSAEAIKVSRYMHTAIVYYDLETTGLNTSIADTIEIAARIDPACKEAFQDYFMSNREWKELPMVKDSFASLIYPDSGNIPLAASKCNGIYMKDVQDKPRFDVIAGQFVEWLSQWRQWCPPTCKRIIVVAHNNFDYDSRILTRQCKKHGIKLPDFVEFGDSLAALRQAFSKPEGGFSMRNLNAIWIPKEKRVEQAHRALADVDMMILIIRFCPDPEKAMDAMIRQAIKAQV